MKMSSDATFKWAAGAYDKLEAQPDKVLYSVARITLDKSYPKIPLSKNKNAGNLRRSSMDGGVRGGNGDYYLGSYTTYAKYVWNMGSGTKWSTPGTEGKWYEKEYKSNSSSILKTAIERNKL